MLKREFKEVAKQTLLLIISVFCLIYPIHLIASIFNKSTFVFSEYFLVFYQLFILFFSFFLGISLFSKEIRNSGFDYLLTLPYSRTKLLLYKIVPRITALVLLGLIYLVLLTISTSDPFLITPISFHALYLPLFFVSTSLSVLRGNFVANSIITGLLFILFLVAANLPVWLVIRKYFGVSESFKLRIFVQDSAFPFTPFSIVLLGFLISFPYVISLFRGFKTYDIRSSKKYVKRFVTLFVPLMVIAVGLSYLMMDLSAGDPEARYYITKKGVVLKYDYSGTYVVSSETLNKLPRFYPSRRNMVETEEGVYMSVWHWENNPKGEILRFNPDFSGNKKVYSPPGQKFITRYLYGYEKTLIFLESAGKKYSWNRSTDNTLVFLDTVSGDTKKFEFPFGYLKLIGVSESQGGRAWIGSFVENAGVSVFTISPEGKVSKILRSKKEPLYMNGQLITFGTGEMVMGRFNNGEYEETGRVKTDEKLMAPFYLHTSDLNRKPVNSVAFQIHKVRDYDKVKNPPPLEFIFLDLSTGTTERFSQKNIKRAFLYVLSSGEQVMIQMNDWGEIKLEALYLVEGSSFKLLRDFSGEKLQDWSDFGMAGNGFGLGKGENVKFYRLPDMTEIKY